LSFGLLTVGDGLQARGHE
jgi:hypothetical protein